MIKSTLVNPLLDSHLKVSDLPALKLSKAFTTDKWVGIVAHTGGLKKNISDTWKPFLDSFISDKKIISYTVELFPPDYQLLLITLRTNHLHLYRSIKPEIEQIAKILQVQELGNSFESPGLGWYPVAHSNTLYLNEFYIPNVNYTLTEIARNCHLSLMYESSKLYLDFMSGISTELAAEDMLERILPKQAMLVFSILENRNEALNFYRYYYSMLQPALSGLDGEELKDFMSIIENNYQAQKEMFIPYLGLIEEHVSSGEEIGEDWLDQWQKATTEVSEKLVTIESASDFFSYDIQGISPKHLFLRGFINAMHRQYGIDFDYEFNLCYVIMNCLKEMDNA